MHIQAAGRTSRPDASQGLGWTAIGSSRSPAGAGRSSSSTDIEPSLRRTSVPAPSSALRGGPRRAVQSRRSRWGPHRRHRAQENELGAQARQAALPVVAGDGRNHLYLWRTQGNERGPGRRNGLEADPGPLYLRRDGGRALPLQLSAGDGAHVGSGVRPHRRACGRARVRKWGQTPISGR